MNFYVKIFFAHYVSNPIEIIRKESVHHALHETKTKEKSPTAIDIKKKTHKIIISI